MPLPLIPLAVVGVLGYALYRDKNKDNVNDERQKEREEWRKWIAQLKAGGFRFDGTASPTSSPTSSMYAGLSTTPRDSLSTFEIHNENDELVISISEVADPKTRKWRGVHEPGGNLISNLNPLLSVVPTAIIGGNVATTKYMVVQSGGALSMAKDIPGAYEPLVRENGKIVEHARLFSPGQLGNMVSVAAVWQVASFVVAQKHLADINKKLELIGRELEEVRAHQKNDRTSKILGCRRYFEQISADIEHGTILSERSKGVIENQCVEILKVEEFLRLEVEALFEKMRETSLGELFNEQLEKLVELVQQLFVCIATRLLGYNLMAIESEDESFVSNRLSGVQRDIGLLEHLISRVADYIVDSLKEEVSFWGDVGKFEDALRMLKTLQPREKFEASFGHVYEEINMAQNIIEQRKAPLEILLKVKGQEIEGFAVADGSNV